MIEWVIPFIGAFVIIYLIERVYGMDNFFKKIVCIVEGSWEFIKGLLIK